MLKQGEARTCQLAGFQLLGMCRVHLELIRWAPYK